MLRLRRPPTSPSRQNPLLNRKGHRAQPLAASRSRPPAIVNIASPVSCFAALGPAGPLPSAPELLLRRISLGPWRARRVALTTFATRGAIEAAGPIPPSDSPEPVEWLCPC